jgi:hypothetical protein
LQYDSGARLLPQEGEATRAGSRPRRGADEEAYQARLARVEEELTLVRIDRYETEVEEFDIEGTLAFAEHLVSWSSRLWIEAGLEQRQRLQRLFFPKGLTFDGREFRTPLTSTFFMNLEGTSGQMREMVEQKGFALA